ncbi:MAG: AAA family ATPase [Alphaproteobacteria bacterium]|nr:AAA family ATPase [Alphaproteobacteria bacterium]
MQDYSEAIWKSVTLELKTLFAAHKNVGLEGKMCLYTHPKQDVWRSKDAGLQFWFGENDIAKAVAELEKHYNKGNLPNSPMLLNPIIHEQQENGSMKPLGSGIIWATAFCLGTNKLTDEQIQRPQELGVLVSPVMRGENDRAGLKMVAFTSEVVPANHSAWTVEGCKELYNLTYLHSIDYAPFYMLSGLFYLAKHGMFGHPDFSDLWPDDADLSTPEAMQSAIASKSIAQQKILDASIAWDAYDNHHSLYQKFGINVDDIERNLKFFNLCARDIALFDNTGVRHMDADTTVGFEFVVNGWIPKGAVTVIGASGGTGKSSLAHNLAVKAAIDYEEGEERPTWLNSQINFDKSDGIIVYLSGEDGPAIVHARAKVYDPQGRSDRLMVMRTDFGDDNNLAGFLRRLSKLPDVSMVVIDPARKYLTGDEEDAAVVSEFFEAIEEFAINRNAAVVVVHHLAKGAKPSHISEIYDLLRGSQVFIDRPRVVIGMYREGPYIVAGLAKNNIPPQLGMVQGERVFARDPDRLELVQLPGDQGIRLDTVISDEELQQMKSESTDG